MSESITNTTSINPFDVALKQLDEAANLIKLDNGMHEILAHPKRRTYRFNSNQDGQWGSQSVYWF